MIAHSQISDDLEDGDFTNDPTWSGTDGLFVVIDDGGDLKLRSNSPGAATYWLSTPNSLVTNCSWEIEVDLRLNTSGSNYAEIHLISDQADPGESQNGWYVRIGGTQDRLELFKKVDGAISSVLISPDDIVNSTTSNDLKLRVERSAEMDWTLFYDVGLTGTFITVGPINDPDVQTTEFFSILIEQNSTASMVNKHYFDDVIVAELPIDTIAPVIVSAQIADANTIGLLFNEELDPSSAIDPTNYSLDQGIGAPENLILETGNSVQLIFDDQIEPGILYSLSISDVLDLAANPIDTLVQLMIAASPSPGSLVINELLYDPIGEGADFVEIFNRSHVAVNIAGSVVENGSGSTVTIEAQRIMLPGEYLLLSPDTADIFQDFPQTVKENALQIALPSFVNSEGSVILKRADQSVIDRFDYHDDLHFDLIDDTEGFSLERVDPDRPADDPTNWQTASDLAGRATPGFLNSQYSIAPEPTGSITIDPSIFSPDNDGYQDLLTITYAFDRDGFIGTMSIFDIAGRELRKLFSSKILGTSGSVSWDGLDDDGGKCRIGAYIVMLEAFDLDGNVQRFKKTITLAHHLDR